MTIRELLDEAISALEDAAQSEDRYTAQASRGVLRRIRKLLAEAEARGE